jgi:C4-dicarboxylate-specific signal transduction histidine kinase
MCRTRRSRPPPPSADRRDRARCLLAGAHGILLIKSVPIWIDKRQPDVLGTLILGASLDRAQAQRFKELTNSEIAFGVNGTIKAATLPRARGPRSRRCSHARRASRIALNGEEYLAYANPLGPAGTSGQPIGIVLRSQSRAAAVPQPAAHAAGLTARGRRAASVLLSYAVARTVTRPVETVTSTMRDMAASGDLTRRIPVSPNGRWQDEDARLLATTFNSMTDSIQKFQREASQRERLSSLGRLSTVVAHEIRNPLMIIKTSLRTLRRDDASPERTKTAVKDIDEENHAPQPGFVSEVLDYARPIKFDLAPVDLNALAADAARAAGAAGGHPRIRLDLDSSIPAVTTDAERIRQALLNILDNALQAVAGRDPTSGCGRCGSTPAGWRSPCRTTGAGLRPKTWRACSIPTSRRGGTGTGIGLAISGTSSKAWEVGSPSPASAIAARRSALSSRSTHRQHDQDNRFHPARRRRNQDPRGAGPGAPRGGARGRGAGLSARGAAAADPRIVRRPAGRQPDAGADRPGPDPRAGRDRPPKGIGRRFS